MIIATSLRNDGGIKRVVDQIETWVERPDTPKATIIKYKGDSFYNKLTFLFTIYIYLWKSPETHVLFTHPGLAKITQWIKISNYSVMVHGWELNILNRSLLDNIFQNAAHVICSTEYVSNNYLDHYSLHNVTQCLYPIPDLRLTSDWQRNPYPTILHVGRMYSEEQYKGHDEMLDAWPSVLKKFPNARLLLVGSGNDKARLSGKISNLGFGESVELLGYINDAELTRVYNKSWIFCMPSSGEGQGLVYGEAMQFGLPVIALRDSPAAEQIRDQEDGLLLKEKSSVAIADSIIRLLENPTLLKKMSTSAKDQYQILQQRSERFWDLLNTLGTE